MDGDGGQNRQTGRRHHDLSAVYGRFVTLTLSETTRSDASSDTRIDTSSDTSSDTI